MQATSESIVKTLLKNGLIEESRENPGRAIELYTKAVNIDPKCEEAVRRISNLFLSFREYDKAIKPLEYLLGISESRHLACFNLGTCYLKLGDFVKAEENFLAVIRNKPNFWTVYPIYTDMLIRLKRINDAYDVIDSIKKNANNVAELHWCRAKLLVTQEKITDALLSFEEAKRLGVQKEFSALLYSEYAFASDKAKNYDKAMGFFEKAQQFLKDRNKHIKIQGSFADKTIKKSFLYVKDGKCKNWKTDKVDDYVDPIFIVGFPRSGTTLCEQVLYSHPRLIATDEQAIITQKSKKTSEIIGRRVAHIKDWGALNNEDIAKWRKSYFEEMSQCIPNYNDELRIIDKLPMQIVHLATIKRFFPNSPIIVMVRDPRDSCLSNFFQTFEHNSMTRHFYDVKSTFKHYARVMKCYLHLRDELDLNLLEIKYEEMCDDFENHARKIISHINEEWDDNVLDYYKEKNSRFVSTPSHVAITKPINKKAIGNWHKYKDQIEPYTSILQPYIEAFGYKL